MNECKSFKFKLVKQRIFSLIFEIFSNGANFLRHNFVDETENKRLLVTSNDHFVDCPDLLNNFIKKIQRFSYLWQFITLCQALWKETLHSYDYNKKHSYDI